MTDFIKYPRTPRLRGSRLFSQVGNWRELLALAHADNLGRIAPNVAETAMALDLLREEVNGRTCIDGPWRFPSDAARVWFGRADGRSPWFDPPPPKGSHVIVLCGPPGVPASLSDISEAASILSTASNLAASVYSKNLATSSAMARARKRGRPQDRGVYR